MLITEKKTRKDYLALKVLLFVDVVKIGRKIIIPMSGQRYLESIPLWNIQNAFRESPRYAHTEASRK